MSGRAWHQDESASRRPRKDRDSFPRTVSSVDSSLCSMRSRPPCAHNESGSAPVSVPIAFDPAREPSDTSSLPTAGRNPSGKRQHRTRADRPVVAPASRSVATSARAASDARSASPVDFLQFSSTSEASEAEQEHQAPDWTGAKAGARPKAIDEGPTGVGAIGNAPPSRETSCSPTGGGTWPPEIDCQPSPHAPYRTPSVTNALAPPATPQEAPPSRSANSSTSPYQDAVSTVSLPSRRPSHHLTAEEQEERAEDADAEGDAGEAGGGSLSDSDLDEFILGLTPMPTCSLRSSFPSTLGSPRRSVASWSSKFEEPPLEDMTAAGASSAHVQAVIGTGIRAHRTLLKGTCMVSRITIKTNLKRSIGLEEFGSPVEERSENSSNDGERQRKALGTSGPTLANERPGSTNVYSVRDDMVPIVDVLVHPEARRSLLSYLRGGLTSKTFLPSSPSFAGSLSASLTLGAAILVLDICYLLNARSTSPRAPPLGLSTTLPPLAKSSRRSSEPRQFNDLVQTTGQGLGVEPADAPPMIQPAVDRWRDYFGVVYGSATPPTFAPPAPSSTNPGLIPRRARNFSVPMLKPRFQHPLELPEHLAALLTRALVRSTWAGWEGLENGLERVGDAAISWLAGEAEDAKPAMETARGKARRPSLAGGGEVRVWWLAEGWRILDTDDPKRKTLSDLLALSAASSAAASSAAEVGADWSRVGSPLRALHLEREQSVLQSRLVVEEGGPRHFQMASIDGLVSFYCSPVFAMPPIPPASPTAEPASQSSGVLLATPRADADARSIADSTHTVSSIKRRRPDQHEIERRRRDKLSQFFGSEDWNQWHSPTTPRAPTRRKLDQGRGRGLGAVRRMSECFAPVGLQEGLRSSPELGAAAPPPVEGRRFSSASTTVPFSGPPHRRGSVLENPTRRCSETGAPFPRHNGPTVAAQKLRDSAVSTDVCDPNPPQALLHGHSEPRAGFEVEALRLTTPTSELDIEEIHDDVQFATVPSDLQRGTAGQPAFAFDRSPRHHRRFHSAPNDAGQPDSVSREPLDGMPMSPCSMAASTSAHVSPSRSTCSKSRLLSSERTPIPSLRQRGSWALGMHDAWRRARAPPADSPSDCAFAAKPAVGIRASHDGIACANERDQNLLSVEEHKALVRQHTKLRRVLGEEIWLGAAPPTRPGVNVEQEVFLQVSDPVSPISAFWTPAQRWEARKRAALAQRRKSYVSHDRDEDSGNESPQSPNSIGTPSPHVSPLNRFGSEASSPVGKGQGRCRWGLGHNWDIGRVVTSAPVDRGDSVFTSDALPDFGPPLADVGDQSLYDVSPTTTSCHPPAAGTREDKRRRLDKLCRFLGERVDPGLLGGLPLSSCSAEYSPSNRKPPKLGVKLGRSASALLPKMRPVAVRLRQRRDQHPEEDRPAVVDAVAVGLHGSPSVASIRKARKLEQMFGELPPQVAEHEQNHAGIPSLTSPVQVKGRDSPHSGWYRHSLRSLRRVAANEDLLDDLAASVDGDDVDDMLGNASAEEEYTHPDHSRGAVTFVIPLESLVKDDASITSGISGASPRPSLSTSSQLAIKRAHKLQRMLGTARGEVFDRCLTDIAQAVQEDEQLREEERATILAECRQMLSNNPLC